MWTHAPVFPQLYIFLLALAGDDASPRLSSLIFLFLMCTMEEKHLTLI